MSDPCMYASKRCLGTNESPRSGGAAAVVVVNSEPYEWDLVTCE